MKYVSVPTEIEGLHITEAEHLGSNSYALTLTSGDQWVTVSSVAPEPGDFFNMTDRNDMYLIPAAVLAKKYKVVN